MISVRGKLINKITYGNDNVTSVYKGNTKIWPTDVNGIYMNQNTLDPDSIIGGAVLNDELKRIINNTHWYCGKLTDKGMLICQIGDKVLDWKTLEYGDVDHFYDGQSVYTSLKNSAAYGIYGNVFIKFPMFSVINEVFNEDQCQLKWIYDVKMPGWINWEGNWLIGLSSCGWENNKIFCHAAVHDLSTTFDVWKERLATLDPRYGFFTYWQRCIFTYLYYSIYGTTRDVLYGEPHYFLGIDAFCSSWQEYLDGIEVNNRVPTILKHDGTTRIGPTLPGSGTNASGGWISKIHMTPYLDIIPKEWTATQDTGYCSHGWSSGLDGCIPRAKGGMGVNDEVIGCGYDRTGTDTVGRSAVRLTYHGEIIETKDVEYFKRVKPINGGVYYDDESGTDKIYIP